MIFEDCKMRLFHIADATKISKMFVIHETFEKRKLCAK